jgi:hypothetical protein
MSVNICINGNTRKIDKIIDIIKPATTGIKKIPKAVPIFVS